MAQHLIHVGYPKAGSTFLQAWFGRHPELCYKPGGLGGFHNVYEIARPSEADCKYYVTSFEGLCTPHESAGDVRLDFGGVEPVRPEPLKENQARVCAVLKSLYPASRILVVTRGFKAMILSGYSQYVRMGGRLHLAGMCRDLAALEEDGAYYYDFDHLLRLYGEAFGEENLIVLPYELLRDDQGRFLRVLEERLGLRHAEIRLGRANPSLTPEELYWYPLISRAVSAAASRLGPARFRRVYRWYVGKTLDNKLRPLVGALCLARPGRKITEADFPAEILSRFEGKAARLKGDPLYAPYAADYLWDADANPTASL
ncbi:MAG TPA: hypothetical protein VN228_04915 [Pyrinomonadaceae bacterium]|nr:hypothetical protein [Pyrinomonadaceae bacterium]